MLTRHLPQSETNKHEMVPSLEACIVCAGKLHEKSMKDAVLDTANDSKTAKAEKRIRPVNRSTVHCSRLVVFCAYQAVEDLGNRRDSSFSLSIDIFLQLPKFLISQFVGVPSIALLYESIAR